MNKDAPLEMTLTHEPVKYDKTVLIAVEQNGGRLAYAYAIYDGERAVHKGAALVPGATTWQGEMLAAKDALTSLAPSQRVLAVTPTDRLHQRLSSGHTAKQFTADWKELNALAAKQDITWLSINGWSGDRRMDACRALAQNVLQSETKGGADSCKN